MHSPNCRLLSREPADLFVMFSTEPTEMIGGDATPPGMEGMSDQLGWLHQAKPELSPQFPDTSPGERSGHSSGDYCGIACSDRAGPGVAVDGGYDLEMRPSATAALRIT